MNEKETGSLEEHLITALGEVKAELMDADVEALIREYQNRSSHNLWGVAQKWLVPIPKEKFMKLDQAEKEEVVNNRIRRVIQEALDAGIPTTQINRVFSSLNPIRKLNELLRRD